MENVATVSNDGSAPSAPSTSFNLLLNAITNHSVESVRQLISEEPQLAHMFGWHRQTALHRACVTGKLDLVQAIVQAGSDVNARNNFNETPLHYACKRGMPPVVHCLLEHGADVTLVDNFGKNVLHHAAEAGSVPVLHMLSVRFPELQLTSQDNHLQSPLHVAIKAAKLEAFNYLTKKGRSNLKLADADGNWPIHVSAREGYGHMTWSQLCVLGLSAMHASNKQGYTPYQLAKMYDTPRHKELIKELEWLSRLSPEKSAKQPGYILWYFHLLAPVIFYSAAILLTRFMTNYHAFVFFPVVAGIMWLMKRSAHRLWHVSRWSNPIFAGAFAAGILHTIFLCWVVIQPHLQGHTLLIWTSYVLAVVILTLSVKIIRKDPGVVKQSAQDPKTGKTLTILDVCKDERQWENVCVDCEIVRPKLTKHCKMCEQCMEGMDHHCLFLLKCVAKGNHSLFVWFILCCMTCMMMFLYAAYLYRARVYGGLSLMETVTKMLSVDAWVLSLVMLNLGSTVWAFTLLWYQCRLIQNGYTAYFQPAYKGNVLSDLEKVMNIINFMTNRKPHAVNPCLDV